MRSLLIIGAISLQFNLIRAYPDPKGVGAYAYQDSTGQRYGGTFDIKDDDAFVGGLFDNYFPQFLRGFDENFNNHIKSFDTMPNPADFVPNFISRFAGEGFGGNNFGPPNFAQAPGMNGAFAGGSVGSGYNRQYAGINPQNPVFNRFAGTRDPYYVSDFGGSAPDLFPWHHITPFHNNFASHFPLRNNPNVDVSSSTNDNGGGPHYHSVQASSYSSSSNINGKETKKQGAETIVNRDGKVTAYRVTN